MRFSIHSALRLAAPALMLLVLPAGAKAQKFEAPPSYNAAQIRWIDRVGENYTILTPVRSDGLMRNYVLTTPYGEVRAAGDAMLRMRLNELHCAGAFGKGQRLRHLRQVAGGGRAQSAEIYRQADRQSAWNYQGYLFRRRRHVRAHRLRPQQCRQDAGQCVGEACSASPANGVILAATYGVDPYTDFPPLDAKLKQLSEAAALGGLTVTGALLAVPGAAGIVVSNLSTANKLNNVGIEDLARNYTASQILDLNRERLNAMGVSPELNAALLANRNYTPIDMAAMVAALDSMHGVTGKPEFFAQAASADMRSTAFFMRKLAEQMAKDHRKEHYVRLVALGGLPFALTRDGRVVTAAPIDALSWTPDNAGALRDASPPRAGRSRPRPKARLRSPDRRRRWPNAI